MDAHDLTAAYALDALGADDREAYEAHLGRCEQCRAELATLGEAASALGWAVVSPAPPQELRDRILGAAAAERQNVVPLPGRGRWVFRAAVATSAAAACAAIVLGVWASSLSHSLSNERSAHASATRVTQILADPASRKVELRGGKGMVAVDAQGHGVLVVAQLPAAPSGKTYEAWVIPPGGTPKRAGLFRGGDSPTMLTLDAMVPPGAVVAATMERQGGVDAPTETPLFSAQA
jgi:anti-sigma-K factor RskA